MSEICQSQIRPVQITLWDIIGETPIEMRKPIDPLLADPVIAQQRKTSRKTGFKSKSNQLCGGRF
jgi:hypothetical protein